MRSIWKAIPAACTAVLILGLVCGCSDSDSGDGGGAPLDVGGRWSLTAEGIFPMTLNLTHNGTAVGGTVTDAERYAVRVSGTTGSPQGAAEGPRNITLVIRFSDGQVATLNGTVAGNNQSMSGRYTTNWQSEGGGWNARRP